MEKQYHVVWFNKEGKKGQLSSYPMDHGKCLTFISKHSTRSSVIIMLEEVGTLALDPFKLN